MKSQTALSEVIQFKMSVYVTNAKIAALDYSNDSVKISG